MTSDKKNLNRRLSLFRRCLSLLIFAYGSGLLFLFVSGLIQGIDFLPRGGAERTFIESVLLFVPVPVYLGLLLYSSFLLHRGPLKRAKKTLGKLLCFQLLGGTLLSPFLSPILAWVALVFTLPVSLFSVIFLVRTK